MSRHISALVFGTSLIVLSASANAEPLQPINDQQSGAAAWVTTSFATNWTDGSGITMVNDSVPFTQEVLARLNAATTPAALRAMPGGLALPCSNGGSMTVRMSRGIPRVLNVEWTGCQLFRWNRLQILTGPGQITLINDTFKPTHVASISLGAPGRDLVMPLHSESSDEIRDQVTSRNVRIVGVIPVSTEYVPEGSTTSLYQVSGVKDEIFDIVFPYPNRAPEHHEHHVVLRNGLFWFVNSWADDFFYTDDDWRYVAGDFTSTIVDPYTGKQTIHWSVDNLRIHRITDYANWTGNYSYDGGFTWNWAEQSPAGCLSGRFALRTKSPFTIPNLDTGVVDSGELSMNNGAANYRQYSADSAPPGLPTPVGTLLSMRLRDGSTFNYDLAQFPDPVRAAANCQ